MFINISQKSSYANGGFHTVSDVQKKKKPRWVFIPFPEFLFHLRPSKLSGKWLEQWAQFATILAKMERGPLP